MIGIEKYSPEEINDAFIILCETDKKIKSSNLNKKLIMQEMVAEIVLK